MPVSLVWIEQTRKCRQNTCWEKTYIYFHLPLCLFFSKLRKLGWYLYSYLIFIFSSLPNSPDPKYPNRKIRRLCLPFPLNIWKDWLTFGKLLFFIIKSEENLIDTWKIQKKERKRNIVFQAILLLRLFKKHCSLKVFSCSYLANPTDFFYSWGQWKLME